MSEHSLQCAFVDWCGWSIGKHPELTLGFAIPNGGKRHISTASKLKKEGVKSGVPDWCLPVARGGYIGFWVEFKWDKNKTTKKQSEYIQLLEKEGHKVVICYTVEVAIFEVLNYLKGEKRKYTLSPAPSLNAISFKLIDT